MTLTMLCATLWIKDFHPLPLTDIGSGAQSQTSESIVSLCKIPYDQTHNHVTRSAPLYCNWRINHCVNILTFLMKKHIILHSEVNMFHDTIPQK